jgi:hypothetical protein
MEQSFNQSRSFEIIHGDKTNEPAKKIQFETYNHNFVLPIFATALLNLNLHYSMSAPKELKFLKTIKTGKGLLKLILSLRNSRRLNKVKGGTRSQLTKKQREVILAKTDGRCHVCGIELQAHNFHADHVKSHITGGEHDESNYLPCCGTCNNLRWHYSSEEIQLIMKLGRWLKTKLLDETEISETIADQFMKHEMSLRKKRKA